MRNVSERNVTENQNTNLNNFFQLVVAVCEIMSNNTVERERPQMTIKCGTYVVHGE